MLSSSIKCIIMNDMNENKKKKINNKFQGMHIPGFNAQIENMGHIPAIYQHLFRSIYVSHLGFLAFFAENVYFFYNFGNLFHKELIDMSFSIKCSPR